MWVFGPSKLHRKKKTWKRRGFFDQQNYIEKVRANDVEFVKVWSSTYQRNIHVESTLIRRRVLVGLLSE